MKDKIEINSINDIKKVVANLKSGKIKIDDLTELQKNQVYGFLKKEVIVKNLQLQELKDKLFKDKIEELKNVDINYVLNKLSEEDRKAFMDFLNDKIMSEN